MTTKAKLVADRRGVCCYDIPRDWKYIGPGGRGASMGAPVGSGEPDPQDTDMDLGGGVGSDRSPKVTEVTESKKHEEVYALHRL